MGANNYMTDSTTTSHVITGLKNTIIDILIARGKKRRFCTH
jgi:hypothetical protein